MALLLPLLAAACTDSTPLSPVETTPPPADALAAMLCTVDIQAAGLSCTAPSPTTGSRISADRMVGNQDMFIKLTNVGGSYDLGTEIFEINVTVQNLMSQAIGVQLDGDSNPQVTGFKVFFFDGPNVTAGTGEVTLQNADSAFILTPNQKYFFYNQMLEPNEISAAQPWRFNVPATVARFTFVVYVMAPQIDEQADELENTWEGTVDGDWNNGANWKSGTPPLDSTSVAILPASMLKGAQAMPVLSGNVVVNHLRVGTGSSLTLGGNMVTAWGNVDGTGVITGGTLWMRGTGVVLNGNLPSVIINGGATLQASARTSGAVSISDGSLVVNGAKPLSISIP